MSKQAVSQRPKNYVYLIDYFMSPSLQLVLTSVDTEVRLNYSERMHKLLQMIHKS